MKYKYSLFWPYVPQEAKDLVAQTLETRWIGQGPKVDEFEQAISKTFKRPFAVSVNSGTSALELAYELLDLGPGDEVITTVLTCTATNIPLLRRGVKLVFADIDPKTLCISVKDVEKKITNKTKAIVGVNLGGIQCELDKKFQDIPVVIDAAQAIGQTNGMYCIYSFQAIKHFTTADGGMLFTPDEETYHKAKLLRWFGIDREKKRAYDWQAYKKREMTFDIEYAGFKYQMHDVAASMGLAGLADYYFILLHRKWIHEIYMEHLSKIDGIKVLDGKNNVYWLATLLVENRDDFAARLAEKGVETNLVQVRNDIYKIFGGKKLDLPGMNSIEDKYISIPLHMNISVDDALHIVDIIKEGW